jgi:beta-glucosidase
VAIEPGETVTVAVEVQAADCTLVTADGRRLVEPGSFELLVGPSSRDSDLLAAPFAITG